MIKRVKEAQTVSDLIKLGHIGFNWVKMFKVVKFGLVCTVSLKSKHAEVLSQDRETQNPYKGCFIEKRSNSDGQVKSYLIDSK